MVFFVREIMETNPKLRPTILTRLLDTFSQIRSSRVCSCALWILSEYCTNPQDINAALEVTFPVNLSEGHDFTDVFLTKCCQACTSWPLLLRSLDLCNPC